MRRNREKRSNKNRFAKKKKITPPTLDYLHLTRKRRTVEELEEMRRRDMVKMEKQVIPGVCIDSLDRLFSDRTRCIVYHRRHPIRVAINRRRYVIVDCYLYTNECDNPFALIYPPRKDPNRKFELDYQLAIRRDQLVRVNAEFKREKETRFHKVVTHGSAFQRAMKVLNVKIPMTNAPKVIINMIASYASSI